MLSQEGPEPFVVSIFSAKNCDLLIELDYSNDLGARLRKMNDAELLRFGEAAKYMCSPQANGGKPPRESFVIQLRELRRVETAES